jgi:DNA helicase-4
MHQTVSNAQKTTPNNMVKTRNGYWVGISKHLGEIVLWDNYLDLEIIPVYRDFRNQVIWVLSTGLDEYLECLILPSKTQVEQLLNKIPHDPGLLPSPLAKKLLRRGEYYALTAEQWICLQEEEDAKNKLRKIEEDKRAFLLEVHNFKERKQALLLKVDKLLDYLFKTNFLKSEAAFDSLPSWIMPRAKFQSKKIEFVRRWFAEHFAKTDERANYLPDQEQLAAIAAVNGNVQVVARAGSGKTATMVNRAFFLLRHCHVDPSNMMLLAFNKKAATEIARRLCEILHPNAENEIRRVIIRRTREAPVETKTQIEEDSVYEVANNLSIQLPYAMTFHALAYALVQPTEEILYDDDRSGVLKQSQVVQDLIDETIRRHGDKYQLVKNLMLAYFKEDWEYILNGHYMDSPNEFLRYRRNLSLRSLGGDTVKSFGEKRIADFLFEHGGLPLKREYEGYNASFRYRYEYPFEMNGRAYRPDFTIFFQDNDIKGAVIEYFGMAGDPDYDCDANIKREYWQTRTDYIFIELSRNDIFSGDFQKKLENLLQEYHLPCNQLNDEEIWERIKTREILHYTRVTANFIGRCRQQAISPDELKEKVQTYHALSNVELQFLKLAQGFYANYLECLERDSQEDFCGLMLRAAKNVDDGITRFSRRTGTVDGDLKNLRYLCVDEFQDFSELFYRLLVAILKQATTINLFCVGDDWQAINGFAGSDLRFFRNFSHYFGEFQNLALTVNYRSASSIVKTGNALMRNLGQESKAHNADLGRVLLADAGDFIPNISERGSSNYRKYDTQTMMVARIVRKALQARLSIVLLNRKNDDDYVKKIRNLFPDHQREFISFSTSHKYKGLEKPVVIVLDALRGSYPLIHPDWFFNRVFGESPEKIEEEERRLFYVALTRAKEQLFILTDESRPSPFLEGLQLQAIDWKEFPPPEGIERYIQVQVGNLDNTPSDYGTFAIRDLLRQADYLWNPKNPRNKFWWKNVPSKDCLQALEERRLPDFMQGRPGEPWLNQAGYVEIRFIDDKEKIVARFHIGGDHIIRLLAP